PEAGLVASKNFDTVFSNCKDKTLQMSVQAANPMGNGIWAYFDSGDPDHAFYYDIMTPQDAEITGGGNAFTNSRVFALNNYRPVLIKPGSDNYTMSSTVELHRGIGGMANVGSALSTSFTYNITYQ
ncbi:hypothetical protein DNL98_26310, partial [Salmonella enterica subsp. enterica serovar Glostrup]|nr:hypothetical protein [Salmonella enterica subsp. enterica serovar Glostrup]